MVVLRQLQHQHDLLRPVWEAPAADVFFADAVAWLAALQRMVSALQEAEHTFLAAHDIYAKAEEEAARIDWSGSVVTDDTGTALLIAASNTAGGTYSKAGGPGMSRAEREHFDALREAADEAEAAAAAAEAADQAQSEEFPPRLNDESAAVDAYLLDLTTVNTQDEYDAFVAGLDAADRPVIFVVHGFNARGAALAEGGGFDQLAAEYEAMYGHLVPPPILVAVTWDGNTLPNYHAAERNAITAGWNLSGLLNTHYREHGARSPINVVAHSQGNVVVMTAVNGFERGTRINSYIAVQAAVNVQDVQDGRYRSTIDGRYVGTLTITYTSDPAPGLRRALAFRSSLGGHRPDIEPVDTPTGERTEIRTTQLPPGHHDYRGATTHGVAQETFGLMGEGLGYRTPPAASGPPAADYRSAVAPVAEEREELTAPD